MQIPLRRQFCGLLGLAVLLGRPLPAAPAPAVAPVRQTAPFDASWHFLKGDTQGAENPTFDDATWSVVDTPHDWSILGPFDQGNPANVGGAFLPTGVSWYRKSFKLPETDSTNRVYLDFDGIMENADVWINGFRVAKRPNGYISYRADLTGHLNFGADKSNVVAVRTDGTVQPASRSYTGQGIYRHVRLLVMNPVHLEHWGVFVTIPQATPAGATVNVNSTVSNQGSAAQQIVLQTTLLGPDGQAVATSNSPAQTVAAGQSAQFTQDIAVSNPKLWNLDSPTLYKAVTRVVADGNKVLDDQTTSFGIRTAEFKPETGFWLNGKNLKILGVCLHSDGGAVGAAVPARVWERRLELLREVGVNAIRTAHNPPSPEFLELCDKMGFLVMLETFDTWRASKNHAEKGYQLHFNDWWEADTRDTVLRDRNHPSVVIYSIGNEIRDNLDGAQGRSDLTGQIDVIHKFDPTRPVTMGLFRAARNSTYLDTLDVIGVNYRADLLAQVVQDNPARRAIDTEETHNVGPWRQVRDTPSTAGLYIWAGMDYLGETAEAQGWPYVISSNASDGFGMLDIDGNFRPKAWQRQSWWSTTPMARTVRSIAHGGGGPTVLDWSPADQDTYDLCSLTVYSNCEEVEVFLNDKSIGGGRMPADSTPLVLNNIVFEPGVLKTVGKRNGQVVSTTEMRTAGKPAKIELTADRTTVAHEFDDVTHITARIADANGIPNPNAEGLMKFQLSGPGKILALSTGDRTSHQPFQAAERLAFNGKCLAIIGSTADAGAITVTVTVEGLPPASITLQAAPPIAAK